MKGWGKLKSATEVEVTGLDGSISVLSTKATIIATGSEVTPLPGVPIDEERWVKHPYAGTQLSCDDPNFQSVESRL